MHSSLEDFVDYVFDFYGSEDAIYPMGATKRQITDATLDYLDQCRDNADLWGYGDSLDRERVRDILINKFNLAFPVS
tara:strand:- start:370 stop:600 length:231 start_codon:yes stop_codon:yes gene_type:complete